MRFNIALLSCLAALPAVAAEPGETSWLERSLFMTRKVPEAEKDSTGKRVSPTKAETDAARRLRAELDWKRRAEVCQKLREIAAQTGDTELERFADRLDERAWDVYLRQTTQGGTTVPAVSRPAPAAAGGSAAGAAPIREVRP